MTAADDGAFGASFEADVPTLPTEGGGAGWPTPGEKHIKALEQNPDMASDFDAKFGEGAAERALGLDKSKAAKQFAPQIEKLAIERQINDRATQDQDKLTQGAGMFGRWGELDDKARGEWVTQEKADAESAKGWWEWARDGIVAARREAIKAQPDAFPDGDPMQDWAERKVQENIAYQKRRRMLAEEMEKGQREAAKYGAARARTDDVLRGTVDLVANIVKGAGYAQQFVTGNKLSDVAETTLYRMGQWVEAKGHEWFPKDEARAQEFATSLAEGAGSMVGFMGPALAAKFFVNAGPKTIAAISGISGALSQSEMADDALKAYGGAKAVSDEEEANLTKVWLASLGIGATEAFPIAHLFAGHKGSVMRAVFMQAAEEGGQEWVQAVLENVVAREYYDPKRQWDDNAWEGALVGALLGGKTQVAAEAIRKLRDDPEAADPSKNEKRIQEAKLRIKGATDAEAAGEPQDGRSPSPDTSPRLPEKAAPASNAGQGEAIPADTRPMPAKIEGEAEPLKPGEGKVRGKAAPEADAVARVREALGEALPAGQVPQPDKEPDTEANIAQPSRATATAIPAAEPAKEAATRALDPASAAIPDERLNEELPALAADIEQFIEENGEPITLGDEGTRAVARIMLAHDLSPEEALTRYVDQSYRAEKAADESAKGPAAAGGNAAAERERGRVLSGEGSPSNERSGQGTAERAGGPQRGAEQAAEDDTVTDADRARFARVLASKAQRPAWAKAAQVSDGKLGKLIEEAVADGRLTMRNGVARRTTKAKVLPQGMDQVAEITKPQSILDMPSVPAEREGVTSAPPLLEIPSDLRVERAIEQRAKATKKPVPAPIQAYARQIEQAIASPDQFSPLLSKLKADKTITRAGAMALANLVGSKPDAKATRDQALATIQARHERQVAAERQTFSASLASTAEPTIGPDFGSFIRFRAVQNVIAREKIKAVHEALFDREAFDLALANLYGDKRVSTYDFRQAAEAYAGASLGRATRNMARAAIIAEFETRRREYDLARLSGVEPLVSGSNLDPVEETRKELERLAAERLAPIGVGLHIAPMLRVALGRPGVMASFAGQKAATANLGALGKAQELSAKGMDPEAIWKETGWFKRADGGWRFEIDDSKITFNTEDVSVPGAGREADRMRQLLMQEGGDINAVVRYLERDIASTEERIKELDRRGQEHTTLRPYIQELQSLVALARSGNIRVQRGLRKGKSRFGDEEVYYYSGPLDGLIKAPDLFKAYPQLRTVKVSITSPSSFTAGGSIDPTTRKIEVATSGDKEAILDTLIHEIQHAIQLEEGFDAGGNQGTLTSRTEAALFEVNQQIASLMPGSNIRFELESLRDQLKAQSDWFSGGVSGFSVTNQEIDSYRRLLGEVEARNATFRRTMTPESRAAFFPLSTEDEPAAEQFSGKELTRLSLRNEKLIEDAVRAEYKDMPDMVRDVRHYGTKTHTEYYGISLSPAYSGSDNPTPIATGRSNIAASMDFTEAGIATAIKIYGIWALRRHLAEHIAYRKARDEDTTRIDLVDALLARVEAKHPELAEIPGYEVSKFDPEGLIEKYEGKTYTEADLDRLKGEIESAIDTLEGVVIDELQYDDRGNVTGTRRRAVDTYALRYDFEAQGLGTKHSIDNTYPEMFAALYERFPKIIDEYRAAYAYLRYKSQLRNVGMSMSMNVLGRSPSLDSLGYYSQALEGDWANLVSAYRAGGDAALAKAIETQVPTLDAAVALWQQMPDLGPLSWQGVPVNKQIADVVKHVARSTDSSIEDAVLASLGATAEIEGGLFEGAWSERFGFPQNAYKKIMAVATGYGPEVALKTFTHEEIHALRNLGVLTGKDWTVLSALARKTPRAEEARRLLDGMLAVDKIDAATHERLSKRAGKLTMREIYQIDQRYRAYLEGQRLAPARVEDLLIEEVVAHAAADWADGRSYGTKIDLVLMKIRDFLEALGNFIKGNGFSTVDQVFNSVWSGELVKRQQEMEEADADAAMFSFAGTKAQTANVGLLRMAERMEQRRRKPEDIHRETGWFRGHDRLWRFEIDDSQALLNDLDAISKPWTNRPKGAPTGKDLRIIDGVPLAEVLDHPALMAAYPFLKQMKVRVLYGESLPAELNETGAFATKIKGNKRVMFVAVRGRTAIEVHRALLHELQHYVQTKEGWDSGASPKNFTPGGIDPKRHNRGLDLFPLSRGEWQVLEHERVLDQHQADIAAGRAMGINEDDLLRLMNKEAAKRMQVGIEGYKKSPGEAEANLTMDRAAMSAKERRAAFPPEYMPRNLDTVSPLQLRSWRKALDAAQDSLAATKGNRKRYFAPQKIGDRTTMRRLDKPGMTEDIIVFDHIGTDGQPDLSVDVREYAFNGSADWRGNRTGDDGFMALPPDERTRFVDDIERGLRERNLRLNVLTEGMEADEAGWWWARNPAYGEQDVRYFLSDIEDALYAQYGDGMRLKEGNGYGEDWSVSVVGPDGKKLKIDSEDGKVTDRWLDGDALWGMINDARKARGEISRDEVAQEYKGVDRAIIEAMNRSEDGGLAMFSFAGARSKTADLPALAQAERMEAEGVDRDTIWRKTGWGRFRDGQWRSEVSDNAATLATLTTGEQYKLGEALDHPELYAAYPEAADTLVYPVAGGGASYTTDAITLGMQGRPSSTILHEIDHAIQQREGFAFGASPATVMAETPATDVARLRERLKAQHQEDTATYPDRMQTFLDTEDKRADILMRIDVLNAEFNAIMDDPKARRKSKARLAEIRSDWDAALAELRVTPAVRRPVDPGSSPDTPEIPLYESYAGEVSARTVEKRRSMTPEERRARPPWYDFDVPEGEQIVQFANPNTVSKTAYSAEPPVDGYPAMRDIPMFAIRAFHGSPHDFDRFDMSRIGTGEGAQAYGHGLYFAEREGVARSYRDALSNDGVILPSGKLLPISKIGHVDEFRDAITKYMDEHGINDVLSKTAQRNTFSATVSDLIGDAFENADSTRTPIVEAALKYLRDKAENEADRLVATFLPRAEANEVAKAYQVAEDRLSALDLRQSPGRIYEVSINADPDDFLDWDKPLSQQSEKTQQAVRQYMNLADGSRMAELGWKNISSRPINDAIGDVLRSDTAGLREAGIPGIRYLDQGSRNFGMLKAEPHEFNDGSKGWLVNGPKGDVTFPTHKEAQDYINSLDSGTTRNYVVFDDALITIVAKDGVPVSKQERDEVIQAMKPDDGSTPMLSFAGRASKRTTKSTGAPSLDAVITDLKNALGLNITQGLWGLTVRQGDRQVKLRPRKNVVGQFRRDSGVMSVRQSRDLTAIAHEGGHGLEMLLGTDLDGMKSRHFRELLSPVLPDRPAPTLAPGSGYSGVELDSEEQQRLVEATVAAIVWRDKQASPDYVKPEAGWFGLTPADPDETRATQGEAALAELVGMAPARAFIADMLALQGGPGWAPHTTAAARYSETGTPRPRTKSVPTAPALSEGFARWFEAYVADPDRARRQAPGFTESFEDYLDAEMPKLLADIHSVQAAYKAHREQAPLDRLAGDLVSAYDKNSWDDLAQDGSFENITGKLANAYTGIFDDLAPIRRAVKALLAIADKNGVRDADGKPISLPVHANPYKLLRLFRDSFNRGRMWLEQGIADPGDSVIKGPSLRAALETAFGGTGKDVWNKENYRKLGAYLVAQRAIAEYDRLDAKQAEIAQADDMLAKAAAARQGLAATAARDAERLGRREDALIRVETRLTDANRARRSAETEMQNAIADLAEAQDALLAAQMARDGRLELTRRRAVQRAEARQREAVRDLDAIREDVEEREVERIALQAEIEQEKAIADASAAKVANLDAAVLDLKAHRARIEKRGASRPPTLQPKEEHERLIAELDKEHPSFAEAATMVHAWTQRLLTVRHKAGFIDDALYAELSSRADWYVPFQRDMTDATAQDVFFRQSGGRSWSPFKKFDGSDRAIINPLEVLSQEAYRTAQQIAFNEAAGALIGLAERVGPGGGEIAERLTRTETAPANAQTFERIKDAAVELGIDPADAHLMVQGMEQNFSDADVTLIWSPDNKGPVAPPVIPYWQNGERQLIRLTDPKFGREMFDAINGLGEEMSSLIIEWAAAPARWLRAGVTTHPNFILRNLLRDIPAAFVRAGAVPVVAHLRGAYHLAANDEFLRLYNEVGGIVGGQNVASVAQAKKRNDVRDLRNAGPLGIGAGKFLKTVEAIESAGRLGIAAAAYKRALAYNPSLTKVQAMQEAAFVTRDVYDWGRRGSKMLAATRLITFLNANLQSVESAYRGVKGQGDRGDVVYKRLKTVLKREAGDPLSADEERDLAEAYKTWMRLAVVTLYFMALYAAMKDDPWYEDIKDGTKSTHSWVKMSRLGAVIRWRFDQLSDTLGQKERTDAAIKMIEDQLGYLVKPEWMPDWLKRYMQMPDEVRQPKPFEWALPANIAEIVWDRLEGRDPRAAERIRGTLFEVLAPPGLPQTAEMLIGLTKGYDVRNKREIISDQLKSLPPHRQFDAYASELAIDTSAAMYRAGLPNGAIVPPKMIDWVLTTQGAYWGKEVANTYSVGKKALGWSNREASTVYDLPIVAGVTGKGARNSKSIEEFWKLASDAGGTFKVAANGYKTFLDQDGNQGAAADYLTRLEPEERAYALTMYEGSTAEKREHPLERLKAVEKIDRELRREMILGNMTPKNRKGKRDFEQRVELSPETQTTVHDILERLSQVEARNTMILLDRPGWKGRPFLDPEPVLAELRAASPDVYDLLEERRQKAKAADWKDVQASWPQTRQEVLARGATKLP